MTHGLPHLDSRSILDLIRQSASNWPQDEAIAAPGRVPLTYSELLTHIAQIIDHLHACGIGRNDRVAVVLPNGPEMATAFLATAAGATSAPLNPNYRASEFEFSLLDLEVKALITLVGTSSPALEVAQKLGIPVMFLSPIIGGAAGMFTLSHIVTSRADLGLPQASDAALFLHTSGTTSRPKLVPLTQANLYASAHNIRTTLALAPSDRCLNVMPLFHIHGLMGALLASLSVGASVVCSPGFLAPRFFEWVDECRPTWYTAVPTIHQSVLERAASENNTAIIRRNPLRFIRSSSSALPPKVMADLEAVFGAPVIESYGMTEASHQMASNPLPPHARKAGSVGVAAGPEVAIMDGKGDLLKSSMTGEVVIRGANVTPGYQNNPNANEAAFTHGWFRTGDQGYLDGDGYLFLTGRLKELINRGGEKIAPREVDDAIIEHPAVAQVVTFAIPDKKLGEDVAVAVVLRAGHTVSEMELRLFATERLADFKVPRRVIVLDEIPKGATGKVQRIGLAEKLGIQEQQVPAQAAEYVAPETEVEHQLAHIWQSVMKLERVGANDSFLALGGDSMLAAQLFARVRAELGVELSLIQFYEAPTIAAQAALVEQAFATDESVLALLNEIEELSEDDSKKLLK